MKIATYNVNGINGRLPVLLRWLDEAEPDVVCLQELKAPDEKFPEKAILRRRLRRDLARPEELERRRDPCARTPQPVETRRGLPGDPDDTHSRYIEAAVNGVLVGCLYLPNGNPASRAEIRLQAALVRSACRACRRPASDRGARRARRRLQRHADRSRRLQAGALARRRPVSAGGTGRLSPLVAQGWTDALRTLAPGRADLHVLGLFPERLGTRTPDCGSTISCSAQRLQAA